MIRIKNPITPRLPSEYQEVEYLQSTGTQHIDTGFIPNQDTRIDVLFNTTDTAGAIGSVDYNWQNRGFGLFPKYAEYGSTAQAITSYFESGKDTLYSLNKNVFSVNGNVAHTFTDSTFTAPKTLPLFALNRNGTIQEKISTKLYSCQIYNNDALIRDFVPCYRKSDNVVGLYDLVNNKFYTNAGTGTFLRGTAVNTRDLNINPAIFNLPIKRGYIEDKLFYGEEPQKYEQLVNYTMLYDLGDECAEITGGWVSRTDGSASNNNNTFAKNSDSLYQKAGSATGGSSSWVGRWFTNNKIDFSNIVKGLVSYTATQSGTYPVSAPQVCIMQSTNNADTNVTRWAGSLSASSAKTIKLVNIDSSLANNYVTVGYGRCFYYYMYNFAMLKQDNWQELCAIAGIDSSSYADEKALCADSTAIATILASEEAVQFMILQCTGSFMGEFVVNSDCLTALNNSPYNTTIQANEHWNKFLSMVA